MSERHSPYIEALGELTTAGTAWVKQATLAFTPEAGGYWLWYTAKLTNSSGSGNALLRLRDNNTGAVLRNLVYRVADNDPANGCYEAVFGVAQCKGTGPQSFSLEFASAVVGQMIRCSAAALMALKVGPDDRYAESLSESLSTAGSNTGKNNPVIGQADTPTLFDKTVLVVPAAGEYLVIASAEVRQEWTGVEVLAALQYGNDYYGLAARRAKNGTNWYSWSTAIVRTLSGEQTFRLRFDTRDGQGEQARIRNASILALRLDAPHHVIESRVPAMTTSQNYQDYAVLNATPAAGPHLVLAWSMILTKAMDRSAFARLTQDGATVIEHVCEGQGGTETGHSFSAFRKVTLPATPATWKTQYRMETGSAPSQWARMFDGGIAVLSLDEPDVVVQQTERRVGPRRLLVADRRQA